MEKNIQFYKFKRGLFKFNKKSQIGTTMTWLVAFIIIFFVIVIFLVFTIIFAGKKVVSFDKDKVELEDLNIDLENQNSLIYFLNQEINFKGENKKIKKFVSEIPFLDEESKKDASSLVKEKLENFLGDKEEKCYIFKVQYYLINKDYFDEKKFYEFKVSNTYLKSFNNIPSLDLFFSKDNQDYKIKTFFYYGVC